MSLHPQAEALLEMFKSRNLPPIEEQDLQEARTAFIQSSKTLNKQVDIFKVKDRTIQGYRDEIAIRIYTPSEEDSVPALVYFHGGGWVIGNIESHDAVCRTFANEAHCKVISVDYSLAPEAKFPVAVEDAYLATKWVIDNANELGIDPNSVAVGGDSAGGNLAAVVCYLANQRKELEIAYQVLFYPSTGFEPTESYHKYGEGYYLTKSTMKWFGDQYFTKPSETQSPLAAPMLIPDEETSELPPALIITAEYDPLCDGGEDYAKKLTNAGVDTTYKCYKGMIHGFISMTAALDDGHIAIKEAANHVKDHFKSEIRNKR